MAGIDISWPFYHCNSFSPVVRGCGVSPVRPSQAEMVEPWDLMLVQSCTLTSVQHCTVLYTGVQRPSRPYMRVSAMRGWVLMAVLQSSDQTNGNGYNWYNWLEIMRIYFHITFITNILLSPNHTCSAISLSPAGLHLRRYKGQSSTSQPTDWTVGRGGDFSLS